MTIELNDRQSCDAQLICNGGFSPLSGFMTEEEYNGVVADMRLPSGLIMGAYSAHDAELMPSGLHSVSPLVALKVSLSDVGSHAPQACRS